MSKKQKAYKATLEWHIDTDAELPFSESPVDRTKPVTVSEIRAEIERPEPSVPSAIGAINTPAPPQVKVSGGDKARKESLALAQNAATLEELRTAIAEFEGIALKNTATNMVFSDGNPKARVMLVGEAPGADEDREGKPFVGRSGQLLDKILNAIGLDRHSGEPDNAVYIANILNWRPPGNRNPTESEIQISLPFIERHIALIEPDVLIFAGGISTKSLLHTTLGISKLRGQFHDYSPRILKVEGESKTIPALATYHPAYLLRSPGQKKLVWQDMLMLRKKCQSLGIQL